MNESEVKNEILFKTRRGNQSVSKQNKEYVEIFLKLTHRHRQSIRSTDRESEQIRMVILLRYLAETNLWKIIRRKKQKMKKKKQKKQRKKNIHTINNIVTKIQTNNNKKYKITIIKLTLMNDIYLQIN